MYTAIAHMAAECHCDHFKGEPSGLCNLMTGRTCRRDRDQQAVVLMTRPKPSALLADSSPSDGCVSRVSGPSWLCQGGRETEAGTLCSITPTQDSSGRTWTSQTSTWTCCAKIFRCAFSRTSAPIFMTGTLLTFSVRHIQPAASPSSAAKALRMPLQVCMQLQNTSQWCLRTVIQRVIMVVWSIAKSGGAPSTLPGQPSSFLFESYDGIMHAVPSPEMLNSGCTYNP